jgi:hypothetical protein
VPAETSRPRRYTGRFVAVYAVLAVILVGSALGAASMAGYGRKAAWSSWKPQPASETSMLAQIAGHVGHQAALAKPGTRRLAVRSRAAIVAVAHPHDLAVTTITVSSRPTAPIQVLPAEGTVEFTLCGASSSCTAPASQSELVRRTAATLALYALKYTGAKNVVVFAPTPVRSQDLVFLFTRAGVRSLLERPLGSDQTRVARAAEHRWSVTTLPAGGAVLVLRPPLAGRQSL